jgi:AcrR family transcriptional regulator
VPTETFFNLNSYKQQRIIRAAIDEFANHSYNEAKLSRIIRHADIPRGSFYQYFEDKMDLYKYLFDIIAQEKIKYLGADLGNPEELPFIELFRKLYQSGVEFAAANPDYIRISRHLMNDRGSRAFQLIIGDTYNLGREYYRNYINTDKKHGRIREDVDTDVLADFILETMTSIAFNELTKNNELDVQHMFTRMEQMLQILQKGIQ